MNIDIPYAVWQRPDLLTVESDLGAARLAKRFDEIQQLAQPPETKLRMPGQRRARTPISVGPTARELQRRTVAQADHHPRFANKQQLERLARERMVATDDGDLGGEI